jgi:hypothetical protein
MKNVAMCTATTQVPAAATRVSARLAVCAYPWQAGIDTRSAHPKHRSEMIIDGFKLHLRWPGDPAS